LINLALVAVESMDARPLRQCRYGKPTRFLKIRIYLDPSGKSALYRVPGTFPGGCDVGPNLRACRDFEAQRWLQEKLRQVVGCFSISQVDRSRPLSSLPFEWFLVGCRDDLLSALAEKADFLAAIRRLSQIHAESSTYRAQHWLEVLMTEFAKNSIWDAKLLIIFG
jgi:hypothetical protein